jgi:hypothetical protein
METLEAAFRTNFNKRRVSTSEESGTPQVGFAFGIIRSTSQGIFDRRFKPIIFAYLLLLKNLETVLCTMYVMSV